MKAVALLAGLLALPGPADAGSCSLTASAPVVFGVYDVFDPAAADSTGSVTFECADLGPAETVRVELDGGGAGSFAPRRLGAGPIGLAYNLYLDASHGAVWGDGTGGTSAYGPVHPPDGSTTITIYGRIPAHQDVAAGAYGDTVTVTVQF